MAGVLTERTEKVAGVCPLLYHPEDPKKVLMVKELKDKGSTGKLAGMWGIGYETVEPSFGVNGESHRQAINRFFNEEVRVVNGAVSTPRDLGSAKLAVVRISPPEMEAWVHAYAFPVTADFQAVRGNFQDEVDGPIWVACEDVLRAERGAERLVFRAGTYEIVRSHLARLQNPESPVVIKPNPVNLPPWEYYRLLEQGFTRSEAMSQLGIDEQLLLNSHSLVRQSPPRLPGVSYYVSPVFSPAFPR